jgi:hypothetical protein
MKEKNKRLFSLQLIDNVLQTEKISKKKGIGKTSIVCPK